MTEESKLIFIVSQPRSGSTLLQKIISNNDKVETVSEPWLLLPLLSIFKPSLIKAEYNYNVAREGFLDYLKKKNAEPEFRSELKSLILRMYKVGDGNYFVDKTPRYYEIIPEIIELFPQAKVLILKRNPFASLYSMINTWSKGKIDFESFATYYRDFLVAPFLIQESAEKFAASPNVRVVNYETIVSDSSVHVPELYQWLNLPYSDSVLQVGANEKVKGLYGDDVYKKEPLKEIKPELTDAWKAVFTDKDLSRFFNSYQVYLGPAFLQQYGYSAEKFPAGRFALGKDKFTEYTTLLKRSGQL